MKLEMLLSDVDAVGHFDRNLEIGGIAYDSRKVKPGDLFVAIRGLKVDGHDYIPQAVEAGAIAVIAESEVPHRMNWLRVKSSRRALAMISRNFYGDPTRDMTLIGVTGTNGKTSITQIIRDLLGAMGETAGVIGTIGNRVGNVVYPASVTTPESLELNQLFHEMKASGIRYAVMEVSSHALALDRVYGLRYDAAVFTNLTQDHLDYHKTMEQYFKAKKKLFSMARASVVNVDDAYGQKLYNELKEAIGYGIRRRADLSAANIVADASGTRFDLTWNNMTHALSTPFFGSIYVQNVMAAIGALLACGIGIEAIVDALPAIHPVRGRLERVPNEAGIQVLVDYAHTPDALDNVLKIARQFTPGRLLCVFGCGGDRDKTKRPKMGAIAERIADHALVTSDNPRTEDPKAIIMDILAGMNGPESTRTVEPDRRAAIRQAVGMAEPGDTIIIAGKGHETYQIVGQEILPFDDVKEAAEALKEWTHEQ